MDIVATATKLEAELQLTASAERAVNEKRYLKSELHHLGVNVPTIRKTARAFARENQGIAKSDLLQLLGELWSRDIYELRKLAVNILASKIDVLDHSDFDSIESLLRNSHTWALIDDLAMNVVSPVLEKDAYAHVTRLRWAQDDNFWVRRTAMLALLPGLGRSTLGWDEFAEYAESMLDEEEFFIRKAIGWVLREVSKHSPELVAAWLEPRAARASTVTMREATKYLPDQHREHLTSIRLARRSTT